MKIYQTMHKAIAVRLVKKAHCTSGIRRTSPYSRFSTILNHKKGGGSYVVDKFDANNFSCRSFDGTSWTDDFNITVENLSQYYLYTTYYFEPNFFFKPKETKSLFKIYLLYFTRYPYWFNKIYGILCTKFAYLHLNKEASASERNQLLQFLVRQQVNNGKQKIECDYILQKFYRSHRLGSTGSKLQKKKMDFYLESLKDCKDIQKYETTIKVSGKAINTIDEFNSQKTKSRISMGFQLLTVILAFVTAYLALH
ncbi:hypothetical protein [Desulfotalea psychrophila]|uniref:Uncharacterized protein n=1 Tax=Desulfotalea psychrophila (strain LSv54 / DSM 12343) TaxID=177439 RepID=Q6AI79_DESPS|nr:hypothetical protein [Desulfotalea psychrophila]CAG37850.1 hypothetical protein DPPA03 [Desulfotalea psychrophila LSv54]